MKVIVACIVAALVLKMVEKFIFPLAWVQGESMMPTYRHGEFIPCTKLFRRKSLKIGDVVIVRNPYSIDVETEREKLVIKRIYSIKKRDNRPTQVYILGDNTANSYDSRSFGFLPINCVVAKAFHSRERERIVKLWTKKK